MAQSQEPFGTSQRFCSSCGMGTSRDARFCPHCGHSAEDSSGFCAHCGAAIQLGAHFCPGCGAAAGAGTAPTSVVGMGVGTEASVEYMGFWIRVAAVVIDGILTGIVGAILDAILGFTGIGALLSITYYVLLTGLKGQTLGKMALGIKVVNAQGNVPGIGRAALREIVGKFVSAIAIGLGYLWVGWDRQKRGWHDHIAGTYVIRKERQAKNSLCS